MNSTVRNCALALGLVAGLAAATCAEVAIAAAASASVPSCRGAQLAVQHSRVDGAAGHSVVVLRMATHGGACAPSSSIPTTPAEHH